MDLVRGDGVHAVLVGDASDRVLVDVGDGDLGAVGEQVLDQSAADLAQPLHRDVAARQRPVVPQRSCAQACIDTNTPSAVRIPESPAPPWEAGRPVAQRVSRAIVSMSAG